MTAVEEQNPPHVSRRPRLAFAGLGWIGYSRMKSIVDAGAADIAALFEPDAGSRDQALSLASDARVIQSLDELDGETVDGLVIASPSALHAEQAIAGFTAGLSVFCQKPLARDLAETNAVIEAARSSDRLLGVDFSYRHSEGVRRIRELVRAGDLGDIFACNLVFHNAYGPDKPWFRDRRLSGGGCLMDLGIHLVDLVLWVTGQARADDVRCSLFRNGAPLRGDQELEDYAAVSFRLQSGAHVALQCSWNLHAGHDAEIEATFYGSRGAARFRNVAGSFYDFTAEHMVGTGSTLISEGGDDWGSGAIVSWARQLAIDPSFSEDATTYATIAAIIERAYAEAMG